MKRLQSILVITLFLLLLASCRDKARRAKVYHDDIAVKTAVVIDSVIDYGDAIHSANKQESIHATQQYLSLIQRTHEKVQQAGNFGNDSSLRSSAIALLQFYQTYISENFVPYFNTLTTDSLNENQITEVDSLHRRMMELEVPNWSNYNNAEKKFSDKYDIMSVMED